jgi:deoxyribonuclease V
MAYESKSRLVEIQKRIGAKVLESLKPLPSEPRVFVGVDAAYSRKYGGVAVAAVVDHAGRLVAFSVAVGEPPLEYIPGLLAFREAPLFYAALQGLDVDFDVLVVDGHGLSHPRHAGIASHMGLALGKPSIGVAKKKLYGRVKSLDKPKPLGDGVLLEGYIVEERGSPMELAAIVRSPTGRRLYISPGAHITLDEAVNIVARLLGREFSLPAPTYYADKLSKMIARQLDRGHVTPEKLKTKSLPITLDMYLHSPSHAEQRESRG